MGIGCFLRKARFSSSVSKNQKVSNIAKTRRKNISYESESAETWIKTTKKNFMKNLHIHIFFHLESLAIKLRGKYQLVQVDILIKDF